MSLLKNSDMKNLVRNNKNIQSVFFENEEYAIVNINLDELIIIENQPFRLQSEEYITSLAEDIKVNGLYSPLLVRKRENLFEIISGRHRYLALKQLGKKEAPCIVKEMTDDEATIKLINANLNQRHNMLSSELAHSYLIKKEILQKNRNKDEKGFNVWEELAKDTPFSEKTIRRFVKITNLNETFLKMVDENELKQQVYLELAKLNRKEQDEVCKYFFDRGISLKRISKQFIENLIMEISVNQEVIDELFEKLNKKKKFKKETEIEELYLKFDIEKSKWIEILDFLNKNKLLKEQEKLSL